MFRSNPSLRLLKRSVFAIPFALAMSVALAPPARAQEATPPPPPPPPRRRPPLRQLRRHCRRPLRRRRRPLPVTTRREFRLLPAPRPSGSGAVRAGGAGACVDGADRRDARAPNSAFSPRLVLRARLRARLLTGLRRPCTTELARGEYHFALAKNGGRAIPAGAVVLNGPAAIHGSYDDRSGLRVLGGIVLVAGIIGGIVMIVASAENQTCDSDGYCTTQLNGPLLGGGIGVIVGSAIIGTILAAQRDSAHITVMPLTLPTVGALKESPMAALGAGSAPQGAALTVKF